MYSNTKQSPRVIYDRCSTFFYPPFSTQYKTFEEWFNAPFACDVTLTTEEELLIINRLQQVYTYYFCFKNYIKKKYLPSHTIARP